MAEYTDARLEHLLSAAIDHSVPDVREAAAQAPVALLSAPDGIVPHQTRRSTALRRSVMGLAACLVLVLGLGAFTFLRPQSVIGIDVNPSIELTANCFDRILSVTPLNEDAVTIIGDMDLKYVDLDIAVNALVGSMALHGYFENGQDVAVLVSVSGGSEDNNLTLQKKLAADIVSAANVAGATASVYTQNTEKLPAPPTQPATAQERAAQNGISQGKQVFIDNLLTLDPTLNESELAAMPIGKIAALAKQRGLDISGIVDYDAHDSLKENIEDFIDDLDDPEEPDDDHEKANNGTHDGQEHDKDDEDDD